MSMRCTHPPAHINIQDGVYRVFKLSLVNRCSPSRSMELTHEFCHELRRACHRWVSFKKINNGQVRVSPLMESLCTLDLSFVADILGVF
jgi:hypothetical protein